MAEGIMCRCLQVRRSSCAPFAFFALAFGADAAAQNLRINGPLAQPGSGDVTFFTTSTDSTRAVLRADARTDQYFELISAPLDYGVNTYLSNGDDVREFFQATGSRILYVTNGAPQELFSVPA